MSTIRVDNFGPSAGGTTYSARGIAKAWVNFNGTGTIAARDSENVSSLTDDGVGIYTVNWTNDFGAADYSVSGTSTDGYIMSVYAGSAAPTVSGVRVTTFANSTFGDLSFNGVISHGDLA